MVLSDSQNHQQPRIDSRSELELTEELTQFFPQLSSHKHNKWIKRALGVLIRMAGEDFDRLDWKILTSAIEDMEKGFQTFHPYRHTRKVTIFGSARISPASSEYRLAVEFARCITEAGFMVLTGAGGGIMQAGNEGAGREQSFGLNIQLPFEQFSNHFIADDPKLINFKYFFTRKLFFLRESDAVALFPGGFGTQDEAFETITLCQTGKYGPAPLVLIDEPDGNYWQTWNEQIKTNLLERGLISPDDLNLYTITNNIEAACNTIRYFYRVYHSSRYVNQQYVMRLNDELTDEQIKQLNEEFRDILVEGKFKKSGALPQETRDETAHLPRLVFHFNQRSFGRLYQMINVINQFKTVSSPQSHPERK